MKAMLAAVVVAMVVGFAGAARADDSAAQGAPSILAGLSGANAVQVLNDDALAQVRGTALTEQQTLLVLSLPPNALRALVIYLGNRPAKLDPCSDLIDGYTYTFSNGTFIPVAIGSGSFSAAIAGLVKFSYYPTGAN